MRCELCHSKDDRIRELEAQVRSLEYKIETMVPIYIDINNPPHPDLETQIMFQFKPNGDL